MCCYLNVKFQGQRVNQLHGGESSLRSQRFLIYSKSSPHFTQLRAHCSIQASPLPFAARPCLPASSSGVEASGSTPNILLPTSFLICIKRWSGEVHTRRTVAINNWKFNEKKVLCGKRERAYRGRYEAGD